MSFDVNAPEAQEAIQAAVDAAVANMAAKNKELLGELKKAKKGQEIDPQTVADLEAQVEKLQGDLTTASKTAKEASKAHEAAVKKLESETGFTQKLLIDNGLLETLGKNGVTNPVHQKAAVAMLRSGVSIIADGESRIAKVGDKALADYVKEWASSEEGKHFVAAPANTGGGATGGSSSTGKKTITRNQFAEMAPAEQAAAGMAASKGELAISD
jgi:hypothetical protein